MAGRSSPAAVPAVVLSTTCTFIAHLGGWDIYVGSKCNIGIPTVIARWGSQPAEYMSGVGFVLSHKVVDDPRYWVNVARRALSAYALALTITA